MYIYIYTHIYIYCIYHIIHILFRFFFLFVDDVAVQTGLLNTLVTRLVSESLAAAASLFAPEAEEATEKGGLVSSPVAH